MQSNRSEYFSDFFFIIGVVSLFSQCDRLLFMFIDGQRLSENCKYSVYSELNARSNDYGTQHPDIQLIKPYTSIPFKECCTHEK